MEQVIPQFESARANRALFLTTLSFSICFACWVINGMLISYLVQNAIFEFSTQQLGWLIAAPLLTGAISRVPLGILTDQHGGRIVMTILMLVSAMPMFLLSQATTFSGFLFCSLGFGFCGGGFAVGAAHVSAWYPAEKQGTALGIFGMGSAGAAITSLAAPQLLAFLGEDRVLAESWQTLPQIYALVLIVTAIIFFLASESKLINEASEKSLKQSLEPFKSMMVWRFGLYYALFFGAFVAMVQWLVPYTVNVYQLSLVQAGILAAIFSLSSGLIRASSAWFSDKYGARSLMYSVFVACTICCVLLSIPKVDIYTPGLGISSKQAGSVEALSEHSIVISGRSYEFQPRLKTVEADPESNDLFLPGLKTWQLPTVARGDLVSKNQVIALGVSNFYYPANFWIFAVLVFIFGMLTGAGKAAVFKFIPDHFPNDVGPVSGVVGLIGAISGFILIITFSSLLSVTGVWATCWIVLGIMSLVCLVRMELNITRIVESEVPNLGKLIESSSRRLIPLTSKNRSEIPENVETLLKGLPFFHDLSHEELHAVAQIGEFTSMEVGELVFEQGDPGDALYVLIKGRVEIFLIAEDDKRIDLAELADGSYFGDLALIDGQPRSASVGTLEKCEFFLISRTQFLALMSDSPRILADVLFGLSDHIRNTNQRYVDINEKKERLQIQAELDRHQSIAQMVAGVAHEINTPLGIVNHAASIITEEINAKTIEDIAKDEDAEEILEGVALAGRLIQDNISRADKLITSFKNLSVRQIVDQKEEIRISEIIGDVLRLYSLKAQASNLDLQFDNQLGEGDVWDGYAGPLGQILLNIISNADRYAYPEGNGGRLDVCLAGAGTESPKYDYVISLKDYGAGIKEKDKEKVFEAFYTTGRSIGGTGIGLSVVYNLVTFQLDGNIELESTLGEGSEFTIYLPKVVEEKQRQTHLVKEAPQLI
ncbi:MAG: NNP family nitrate/nitrite transporter-like MFS transporter [Candidatus Azotimanducaceae bacterium]|jgi:NNP family nitrate/nitrite transporter-like MFS transporter